jgi:hypothetical protein
MFNRALGMVTPIEQDSQQGLDICWVDCNDPNVQHKFREKLRDFEALVDQPSGGGPAALAGAGQQHTVTLQFFTSRVEKGWVRDTKIRKTWEEWKLPLTVVLGAPAPGPDAASADRRRKLSSALRERMMWILGQVDAKKDHLPEISKQQVPAPIGVTYEWDLFISDGGGGGGRGTVVTDRSLFQVVDNLLGGAK